MNETTSRDGRKVSSSILVLFAFAGALLASATAGFATTPSVGSSGSASEISTLASGPREVRYLCSAKKDGVLRYVTGPKRCTGKENVVRISSDRPITACASDSSGVVRRIASSSKCRSGEDRMTLPGKEPQRFCAAAGSGRLIYDPNGPCEPEDIPVVVPAANKAPSARADAVTVDEDGSVDITLRATDPDGDRLTYSIENDPDDGEVTGSDTDRTYTPDADFNGNDAFVFRVSDGKGGSDTARVSVSVTPVNDAPIAEDDSKFTPENTPLTFPASDLLANDSEGAPNENAQNLTVRSVSGALHGDVDLTGGQITFTPETDYKGPASFEYEVCDDGTPQLCSTQTATVSVAITPVNSKPAATDGTASMDEDDPPITIDLGALVSDDETIDADLTYTITDSPSASEGELTGTGSTRTFDSAQDFNGTVEISYGVTDRGDPDGCGAPGPDCAAAKDSDVAKVTVTVDPVNDAPESTADSYAVDEDGALNVADGNRDVLSNDADVEGDPLTAAVVSNPSHAATFALNPNGSFDYAPAADYFGSDEFTYRANDGTDDGNTVTVTIDVRTLNDAPTAVDDSTSTDEDTEKVFDPRANDSKGPANENGQSLAVAAITDDAQYGTATVTDGGSNVSYEPNAEYSGSDSFTYEVCDDGQSGAPPANDPKCDTADVSVSVAAVNDAPDVTASSGSVSYTEGQTSPDAPVVDDGLTISDVDNADLTGAKVEITNNFAQNKDELGFASSAGISGSYDSGTGVLTLTGTASVSDYQAALRTVTFRSSGDDPGSATRTVRFTADDGQAANNTGSASRDVTVTPVNDAPTNTLPSGPLTVAQDKDVAVTGISVADPDAGNGDVTVVFGVDDGEIALKDDVAGGLTPGDITGNDTATVTTTATLAKINATLGDANGFVYHSDAAFTGLDTLTMSTNDNGNSGTGGNGTDTDTLSLDVKKINAAPIPTDDDVSTDEDTTLTFLASTLAGNDSPGAGEAGQSLTVTGVNATADTHGTVSLIDNGAGTADDEVRYVPDTDYNGPASFEYTLKDDGGTANGGQDTATGTVNVAVRAVNDAPVATDDSRTTDEDTDLTITASDLVTNDAKGPITATDETSQNLTVTAVGSASGGAVSLSGGQITFDPASNFNGDASFEYTVRDDGQTNGSNDFKTDTGKVFVTVTAVNDAPALTVPATFEADEDVATALTGISASDVDAGTGNVVLTLSPSSGTISATDGSGVDVGGTPTATTLTGTVSDINAFVAASNVEFTSASNSTDDVTLTVSVDDGGNTGTGGAKTDSETATINIRPVNDAPAADAESFSGAIGNTKLAVGTTVTGEPVVNISGDVLTGDTDVEGDTLTAGLASNTNPSGGRVVSMNPNGTFTYVPDDGFTGDDTFSYEVCDDGQSGEPLADDPQCSTGSVTITVADMVWYVKNDSAAGGMGRSTEPFDTLAEAQNASSASQTIFVYRGDGATTGQNAGILLKNGQRLLGEHVGLTVGSTNLLGANAGNRPVVGNAAGAGVSIVANTANGSKTGVEVRGFSLSGSTNAVDATSADGASLGVTISENVVSSAGQEGIDVDQGSTGSATLAIHDNNITSTGNALDVARNSGTATVTRFDDNTVSGNAGASGIVVNGPVKFDATPGTSAFDVVSGGDTDVGGSGNGVGSSGMVLTNVSGDLSFADLDVYASNGSGLAASSGAGFSAAGGTGLRLGVSDNAGTFEASGGPALDASGAQLGLSGIGLRSTNSPTLGVSLVNTDGSTVTTTSGSGISGLTSAASTAFRVDGSTGTYTYNGTINTTIGKGVELTNNAGGTITFGGTLTLSTGTNPAFAATGGGTVTASDTASTLTSTTGTALNVSTTNIGSNGLKFRSISANGAPNGIVLNNTGTSGGLTVTGGSSTAVGGDGSGGTISNSSGGDGAVAGNGVYLNRTDNVTLRRMRINDHQNHGIRGIDSSDVTLEYSTVGGANGTSVALDEGSVNFDNLTGAAAITSSVLEGGLEDNLNVVNTGGTLNRLTISGSTFGFNNTTNGNNNILIESQNAGTTLNFTLKSSTIKGARADWLNASNNSGSAMNAVIGGPDASDGNTFDNLGANAHTGAVAGGNRLVMGSVGNQTVDINNNTLKGSKGEAIRVRGSATGTTTGTVNGRVRNNTIGGQATANSGSSEGSGIFIFGDGGSDMNVAVANNVIYQYNNHGIGMTFGDEINNGSVFNVTVTGNTISSPGTINTDFNAIHLNNGTVAATDDFTSCVDIGGAGALSNSIANGGKGSVNPNNTDVRLRQRQDTTVLLPGYGGGNTDTAAVQSYLRGRNATRPDPDGAAASIANASAPNVRGFQNGGVQCTQPTLP